MFSTENSFFLHPGAVTSLLLNLCSKEMWDVGFSNDAIMLYSF